MALPDMEDFEESLNDDPLFDDDPLPFVSSSPYIKESKLNDFFKFDGGSAINLMHINCRSLKKNFREILNFWDCSPSRFQQ